MRVLFTFMGGSGHFEPLAPIARAAEAAGHTVAFGCGPAMAATVAAAGFTALTLGAGTASAPERAPLRPLDAAREDAEFRDRFVRIAAQRRAPLTIACCSEWRPDVLVCDEADFGGMVAAERSGIPYATVLVMAAGSFVRAELIGEALGELRAANSLPPDPELAMLSRFMVLSPFPPSYRDPAFPLPATAHLFRALAPAAAADPPPVGSAIPGAPLVYFTLGTIFNMESGDLFARVLAGLRELPINLIVTVGQHVDPAELGPQPANVQIERYIPQAAILPHCSAVVSHGGSGSVLGALTHGLPSLLIPMGADQPLNAARCVDLGIALALDPIAATSEQVRAAAATILGDPAYRVAAAPFRAEVAAMPDPAHAVALLERLARERRPIARADALW
jgi:UDP:flavonoid glycosyltransferase YjiC (YdhE family)